MQNSPTSHTDVSNRVTEYRIWGALALIAAAALARLIPHPANVTPVIAMALFAGASLGQRPWALAVPVLAMLVSDLVLGFHQQMAAVYGAIILIALLGFVLRKSTKPGLVAAASIASSLLFFVITNFTVWFQSGMYPRTVEGLIACYVAALPFLRNALIGDLVFSAVLFGSWALVSAGITRRFATALSDRTRI